MSIEYYMTIAAGKYIAMMSGTTSVSMFATIQVLRQGIETFSGNSEKFRFRQKYARTLDSAKVLSVMERNDKDCYLSKNCG